MIVQPVPYPAGGTSRQVMVVGDPILGPTYLNASTAQRKIALPSAAYYNE